jgi:hypothetical protein
MRLEKKERKTWKLVFNFSILYRVWKTYFKGYQQFFTSFSNKNNMNKILLDNNNNNY